MHKLACRSHINVDHILGKPLVIYEDHRALVYVLWHAMHIEPVFSEPPLLVYFDAHDDGKSPSEVALASIKEIRDQEATDECEIYELVEWKLSHKDDDWLKAAFELGLIKDAISIGVEHHPNFNDFHTIYTDTVGHKHHVWRIGHLWSALGHQGDLSDFARSGELKPLWDALRWKPTGAPVPQRDPRVVLDFDLDCFTGTADNATLPWPRLLIRDRFTRREAGGCKMSALEFLNWLEPQVAFRTIARESPWCGGSHASQRILESLDETLWRSELFPY